MDWIFYLTAFLVLFGLMAALLSIRYFIHRRLEKYEKKRHMEEQARETAKSNSGL
jgi:hypothetical protein